MKVVYLSPIDGTLLQLLSIISEGEGVDFGTYDEILGIVDVTDQPDIEAESDVEAEPENSSEDLAELRVHVESLMDALEVLKYAKSADGRTAIEALRDEVGIIEPDDCFAMAVGGTGLVAYFTPAPELGENQYAVRKTRFGKVETTLKISEMFILHSVKAGLMNLC